MQYTNYVREIVIENIILGIHRTHFECLLPFVFLSYLPSNTVVRAGAKQIELNIVWLFKAIKLAWQLFVLFIYTQISFDIHILNYFWNTARFRNVFIRYNMTLSKNKSVIVVYLYNCIMYFNLNSLSNQLLYWRKLYSSSMIKPYRVRWPNSNCQCTRHVNSDMTWYSDNLIC